MSHIETIQLKWFSVNEKLPDYYTPLLLKDHKGMIVSGYYDECGNEFFADFGYEHITTNNCVTERCYDNLLIKNN